MAEPTADPPAAAGDGGGITEPNMFAASGLAAVVASMERNPDAAKIQEHGVGALWHLCEAGVDAEAVIASRALEAVMDAMKRHEHVELVQELGCGALSVMGLAVGPQLLPDIVDLINNAMAHHILSGGVQELGSEALARLYAENPDMAKLFATAATVESVLTALQTHPNEHEVQARGFWLLEELTRTPRCVDASLRALPSVLEAMETHAKVEKVGASGCGVLRNIGRTSDERRDLVISHKGVDAIVRAMNFHPNSHAVQRTGIVALGELCYDEESGKQIASGGGVEEVVAALKNIDEEDVLMASCRTLEKLAASSMGVKTLIVKCDAPRILRGRVQQHPSARLAEAASAALAEISTNHHHKQMIVDAGGVDAVLRALDMHTARPHIVVRACGAIRNLANDNDAIQEEVGRKGAVRSVLDGMEAHPMDPEVQAAGCATLAVLGRYADNLERIVVDEGMDVLMAAMDNHAENPDVLQEGLFLIYLLARSNAENRRVLLDMDAVSIIIRLMKQYPDKVGVAECACAAIEGLVGESEETASMIAERGGVELVTDAMERHADSVRVQHRGCLTLSHFAFHVLVTDHLLLKTVGAIARAMVDHPKDSAVQSAGCACVEKYSSDSIDLRALLCDTGIVPLVVRAMETFPENEDVQERGCSCIFNLTTPL